jgi:hypothetical protein
VHSLTRFQLQLQATCSACPCFTRPRVVEQRKGALCQLLCLVPCAQRELPCLAKRICSVRQYFWLQPPHSQGSCTSPATSAFSSLRQMLHQSAMQQRAGALHKATTSQQALLSNVHALHGPRRSMHVTGTVPASGKARASLPAAPPCTYLITCLDA